jgi:hypothetical protein
MRLRVSEREEREKRGTNQILLVNRDQGFLEVTSGLLTLPHRERVGVVLERTRNLVRRELEKRVERGEERRGEEEGDDGRSDVRCRLAGMEELVGESGGRGLVEAKSGEKRAVRKEDGVGGEREGDLSETGKEEYGNMVAVPMTEFVSCIEDARVS